MLPTLEQYNEAVQNPQYAFIDPELQTGQVRTTGLGLPNPACGGFALTYNFQCSSGVYAVRCFHKESRELNRRYAAISRKLATLHSDYFVDFQFQEQGIKIRNALYPVVKMKWAKGKTIGEFLDNRHKSKQHVANLRKSLEGLAGYLESSHIAHGDIQPGNIMVDDEGKNVQLIDYDGMYLPELQGLGAQEAGKSNFQHPLRQKLNPWNDALDRFSFILIAVALDAIEADPSIWHKTQSDGDTFLFSANDIANPAGSATFAAIARLPGLRDRVAAFSSICLAGFDDIPRLADFLNNAVMGQAPAVIPGTPFVSAPAKYIAVYPVLDAHDYDLCLQYIGDMVELVGQVVDVKRGLTRQGKPYYFINFSDWRGNAVKISVWSEYLSQVQDVGFEKLKGSYISITGLLQPPYERSTRNFAYSHITINLEPNIRIKEISQQEARYRLDYQKDDQHPPVLGQAQAVSGSAQAQTRSVGAGLTQKASTHTSNQDILKNIVAAKQAAIQSQRQVIRSAPRQPQPAPSQPRGMVVRQRTPNLAHGAGTGTANQAILANLKKNMAPHECPVCGQGIPNPQSGVFACPHCGAGLSYDGATGRIVVVTSPHQVAQSGLPQSQSSSPVTNKSEFWENAIAIFWVLVFIALTGLIFR